MSARIVRADIGLELERNKASEKIGLTSLEKPAEHAIKLQQYVDELWSGSYDPDIFKNVSESLRKIEGAVCRKYESLSQTEQDAIDIGDLKETINVMFELKGWFCILYRFPALIITVAIASSCIPLAQVLEKTITDHPILGGFPPAISAAAGCIGIQNTAIIIRALGLNLIKSKSQIFFRYLSFSILLSLIAALIEALVAWIVVSVERSQGDSVDKGWTWEVMIYDAPIVIFFSMIITGSLAGIIGAGIPLFVVKLSEVLKKNIDPAHWVGPIETVVQEFCASVLTFGIAALLIT